MTGLGILAVKSRRFSILGYGPGGLPSIMSFSRNMFSPASVSPAALFSGMTTKGVFK
jgi:hypothetical protein